MKLIHKFLFIFLTCFLFSIYSEERHALVIGNSDYNDKEQWVDLPFAAKDVESMKASLESLGFRNPIIKLNPTKREIDDLIVNYATVIENHDGVSLFYYSGHGVQYKGKNFAIMKDSKISSESQLETQTLNISRDVIGAMASAKDKTINLVILDSCRTGTKNNVSSFYGEGFSEMKAPKNTFILYGTSLTKQSFAGYESTGNSVFTQELIKNMAIKDLELLDVFRNTVESVETITEGKQTPTVSFNGSKRFYFTKFITPKKDENVALDSRENKSISKKGTKKPDVKDVTEIGALYIEAFGGGSGYRYMLKNIDISKQGRVAKVKSNSIINVTMDVFTYCQECGFAINQIIIGLGGQNDAQACVFSGVSSGPNAKRWQPVRYSIKVPKESGIYYLRSRYAQGYGCDDGIKWWKVDRPLGPIEESNIGAIVVN